MLKTFVMSAAAAILICGDALSATTTQTLAFTDRAGTFLLAFDPFDASLGTFRSATIDVSTFLSIDAGSVRGLTDFFDNPTEFQPTGNFFIVDVTGTVSLASPVDASIDASIALGASTAFCQTSNPNVECVANYRATGSIVGTLSETSLVGADFIGRQPSIFLSVLTSVNPAVLGQPVSDPTTIWTASGTATLTYEYDAAPVPVPASLPLALGGLAILGGLRVRQRTRR